jgi:hypothetical protein
MTKEERQAMRDLYVPRKRSLGELLRKIDDNEDQDLSCAYEAVQIILQNHPSILANVCEFTCDGKVWRAYIADRELHRIQVLPELSPFLTVKEEECVQ